MERKIKVLIVDDEDTFRNIMAIELSRMGYDATCAENGEIAIQELSKKEYDIVVLDIKMPDINGVDVLKKIKGLDTTTEVLMLTGEGTIESAVESMKSGAYDFITKPCKLCELDILLKKAYEKRLLSKENTTLKYMVKRLAIPDLFIGESEPMKSIFKLINKVAPKDCTVLIQGESGAGKELVARAIHEKSQRSTKPFVVINCAALSETLLESELFGHTKGAFTGANQARVGLFEVADESTLFLDEIGELSPNIQAKLLRALQSGEIRRIGDNKIITVNTRIIAATNKDLKQEVSAGRFRDDLFYRLMVVEINLPPLRYRKDDIPLLIEHFISKHGHKGIAREFEPQALEALRRYDWPGNVRELENVIERLVILSDDEKIRIKDIPSSILTPDSGKLHAQTYKNTTLPEVERNHIINILYENGGDKKKTADSLAISLKTLYNKLKLYKIDT